MELEFGNLLVGFFGILFSGYGAFLVYSARKKLTPGLVKNLVDMVWYSFLNLAVYSVWILLVSSEAIIVPSAVIKEIPTITLLFLFLMMAIRTKQLADEYGFAAG